MTAGEVGVPLEKQGAWPSGDERREPDGGRPELHCWNCDASLAELPRPITRHMNCPACFEDLHCCRMCRHFRANATAPCADERAEPPVHKEGANFCDYFRPVSNRYRQGSNERQARAKAGLNALFKPAETSPQGQGESVASGHGEEDEARRRLNDLFRS